MTNLEYRLEMLEERKQRYEELEYINDTIQLGISLEISRINDEMKKLKTLIEDIESDLDIRIKKENLEQDFKHYIEEGMPNYMVETRLEKILKDYEIPEEGFGHALDYLLKKYQGYRFRISRENAISQRREQEDAFLDDITDYYMEDEDYEERDND